MNYSNSKLVYVKHVCISWKLSIDWEDIFAMQCFGYIIKEGLVSKYLKNSHKSIKTRILFKKWANND